MFKRFDYVETVDSTNDYLKRFAEEGIPRIVVAREQTAGKGQYNRSWHSAAGEGLYVSYLCYPGWESERIPFLNMAAALAVLHAIRQHGGSSLALKLKLPNDVLIGDKKVCGILTELSTLADRISWAIIGIGVNLHHKSFPPELRHSATSLEMEGVHISHPLDFCDSLTRELERICSRLFDKEWEAVQAEFEQAVERA